MSSKDERRAALAREQGVEIEPLAPPTGLTPEQVAQIAQVVAATLAAMPQAPQAGVADAITQALKQNRDRIPENSDADFPARSHYHPGGKDVPRPKLAHETFLGVWDLTTGQAIPYFPVHENTSTDDEIVALNAMVPGTYDIKRADNVVTRARVVDALDAFGNVRRRVIAFPASQFEKDQRNTLPALDVLAQQLTA